MNSFFSVNKCTFSKKLRTKFCHGQFSNAFSNSVYTEQHGAGGAGGGGAAGAPALGGAG